VTVIAANKDMLCGDSQASRGDLSSKVVKVFEVNGDFIGIAGDFQNFAPFIEWYAHKGEKPVITDNFVALILTPSGKMIEYSESLYPMPIMEKYHSIGNGSEFATGAMAAGATPEEAVTMACKRIHGCGLPVVKKERK